MPTIRFLTSGCAVDFPDGDDVNMLRVAIRNDCDVPYKCASGNCGTDRVLVVAGAGPTVVRGPYQFWVRHST